MTTELVVDTTPGQGRWLIHSAAAPPKWWLLLGHGAGGGLDAVDLMTLAADLPPRQIAVALFEQPWVRSGKKVASRPTVLDQAWLEAVPALFREVDQGSAPLAVGGRSAGARVACRTAAQLGADAVVNLAFPLHPPGKPDKTRLDELTSTVVPTLTLQGERDPFGGTDELLAALAGTGQPGTGQHQVVRLPRAAHDLKMPLSVVSELGLHQLLADSVADFLLKGLPASAGIRRRE